MPNYLLCCDWGTSSFRLQLVNKDDQRIIGEVRSTEGVSNTFDTWKKEEEKNSITRHELFRQQLNKQINILAHKLSIGMDNISIVISGMASSSIGMEEIPYAVLPFLRSRLKRSGDCFCKTYGERSGNAGKTLLFQNAVKKFATDKYEGVLL